MFGKHVSGNLSAYCHGELGEAESRRVAEHLIGCKSCRREFEEVKLGVRLAGQLPLASSPASLWSEIETALDESRRPAALRAEPKGARTRLFRWPTLAAACAALLLMLVAGLVWYSTRRPHGPTQVAGSVETQQPAQDTQEPPSPATAQPPLVTNNAPSRPGNNGQPAEAVPANGHNPTWEVARLEGAPTVGANRLEGSGRLGVGQWLETDATSRAKINVADIGQVDIGPNSRVQLVGTRSTEHRLSLQRGRMHAMINAPPRLFIVETPSATAIDLGCSYTLEVDDAGRSRLHVTSGWVALDSKGRESIVPAGAVCVTEPGKGIGTPYFDDASARFRDALTELDFQNGGARSLDVVLSESREHDTLTLWHLLSRVRGAERARVYERMAALAPPPQGVTRMGVLKLNPTMLDLWKQELEWAWFE